MRRRLATLAAALLSPMVPCAARAQQVSAVLDLGVASVAYDQYARSTALVVAPSILLARPGASLETRTALSLFEGGSRSAQAGATGRITSRARRAVSFELVGEGGTTLYAGASPILYGRVDAVARLGRDPRWRVWAGPTVGVVSGDPGARRLTGFTAGLWGEEGQATYGARVTPAQIGTLGYADTELWGVWGRGRVEVSASTGVRAGDLGAGVRAWLNGSAAVWLSERYALVAGVGAYPADLVQGVPGGRFGTVAVRLRTRRHSAVAASMLSRFVVPPSRLPADVPAGDFMVQRGGPGSYRLQLRAPTARQVELMGDFSNWEPVALSPARDGSWAVTLRLSAGPHRFNVRVDGGPWTVPAGVAAVHDDYGGTVGVLTIGR